AHRPRQVPRHPGRPRPGGHDRGPAPCGRHPRDGRGDRPRRGREAAGRHRRRRGRHDRPWSLKEHPPMADPITGEDPGDPRLSDYTRLTDVELRRRREPAEGLFIAEGEKVIRRARAAGYEMRSMLLSEKWLDTMRDVIDEVPAPVYVVSP